MIAGLSPAQGSIGTLTDAFLELAQSHIHAPGLSDLSSTGSSESADLIEVGSLIQSALARLQQLDPLGGDLLWEEWVELFRRVLDETSIPIEAGRHQGVQVLDAMTARGRTVRALFLLGMNEKIFPRYVREDPFLRDRQRALLASTLGYKIDEKLAGHEEELLLFELLSRSATNRLYLSYQRADETGRVMAPSSFIAMAMRDPRFIGKPEETGPSTPYSYRSVNSRRFKTCYRPRIWSWVACCRATMRHQYSMRWDAIGPSSSRALPP